jgi:hypothetical protein
MNNYTVDELAKKDFFICLGIWVVLEAVCFLFFPVLKFIEPGERLRAWFWTSVPLGLGGSFLSAASSRFLAITNDRHSKSDRASGALLGQLLGWVGLSGVAFPLIMVAFEFYTKVMTQVEQGTFKIN